MKKILIIVGFAVIFLFGLVWADSNGIWHSAEDIKSGTFAVDEGYGDFVFENLIVNSLTVDKISSNSDSVESFEILFD